MDIFLWLAIAFLALVLIFVIRADLELIMTRRVHTCGTVYDHRRTSDGDGTFYSVMVRFAAEDGRSIEFTDDFGRNAPKPPVGTSVAVVYPAGEPEKARLRRIWVRFSIYAFLLGGLAILAARLLGWLRP